MYFIELLFFIFSCLSLFLLVSSVFWSNRIPQSFESDDTVSKFAFNDWKLYDIILKLMIVFLRNFFLFLFYSNFLQKFLTAMILTYIYDIHLYQNIGNENLIRQNFQCLLSVDNYIHNKHNQLCSYTWEIQTRNTTEKFVYPGRKYIIH